MSRVVRVVFVLFLVSGGVFRVTVDSVLAQDSTKSGGETKVILCFGNSLTAGYGVEPSQAFPAVIQEKIDARGWKFRIVNAGLSGETTAGGLRRIDWVLQRPVDVLVLELGANDGLRGLPIERAKQNLQAIIDRTRSKYPDVRVVLAGMRVPSNLGREYTSRFRAIFPELAEANKAALVPFLLEGVGGVLELNLPDGIHPTSEGQKLVAENVWKVLEPVLEELR